MTNTRQFLEDKLILSIENRKKMEEKSLQNEITTTAQLKDYYLLQGGIDMLNWALSINLGQVGFHYYRSGLSIEDVLAAILPRISNHDTNCECHECITNDVLQDFIKHGRGIA
jgi:uncharacterized protein YbcC (UPF0753/DUF2309 family)